MSDMLTDAAVVLCEQPLTFEYRNGLFYVCDPALGMCRAFRPNVLAISIWRAQQALELFRAGSNIVAIGPKVPPQELVVGEH
jgi:hypothetical protein